MIGSLITRLGATTIICAIGFEPFLQQLVTYTLRDVPSRGLVASMRILSHTSFTPHNLNWKPLEGRQFNTSIRSGIYDGNSYPRTMPICPNGNCRWPRYHAIAFCSKCADVTNLTKISLVGDPSYTNLSDTINQIILDTTVNRTFLTSSKYPTELKFEIALPNGRSTNVEVQIPDWSGWMGPGAIWNGWYPWENGAPYPSTIINTNHTHEKTWALNYRFSLDSPPIPPISSNDCINMTVAGIPGPLVALGHLSIDWIGDTTERGVVKVQECALTPCVQEYEARVTNNTLFQEVLSTTYGRVSWITENGFSSWAAVVNGTSFNISDAFFDLSYITLWTNAFLIGSVSQYADITCDISNYTQASDFSSNCIVETHTQENSWIDEFPASSEETQAIFAAGNFSQVLTSVAGSMTDLTRRFYNTQVLGDVLVAEAFVHVRWIWVTLPLLLLSTSLLILSVTIYQTMRSKIALWKLSSLPLLYHGPDHMAARSDSASSPA